MQKNRHRLNTGEQFFSESLRPKDGFLQGVNQMNGISFATSTSNNGLGLPIAVSGIFAKFCEPFSLPRHIDGDSRIVCGREVLMRLCEVSVKF